MHTTFFALSFRPIYTHILSYTFKKDEIEDYILHELERKLLDTNKRIQNIVAAVSMGLVQESFITEMSKLEDDKIQMGIRLTELKHKQLEVEITEDTVVKLLSNFRQFVKERNIPECKKFIQHYVKKVVVYPDKVESIYTVASLFKNADELQIMSENKISEDDRVAV